MAAYTTIDDPSANFQTVIYTGNATDGRSITNNGNSNLQPDFVWGRVRNAGISFWSYDSSRGATKRIYTDFASTEATITNGLQSFNSNGFTIGDNAEINGNSNLFVAWQWKANGGTTSSNTDGATTSTVQANTDAGFSIVTFTTTGSTTTFGHGLGAKPNVIISKHRTGSNPWYVFTDVLTGSMQYGVWNDTNAFANSSYNAPTSTVFELNDDASSTHVAYCFAEKKGYSKFGRYTGNGSADGPFVFTGFKPAFVMLKNSSAVESWVVYDNQRNPYNPADLKLSPDTGFSENGNSGIGGSAYNNIDILSNGFKLITNNAATNGSGNKLLYMAFAENPFVTSTGIPTTAR